MLEKLGWLGAFEIMVIGRNGDVHQEVIPNRILNGGLNLMRDGLSGDAFDLEIKYLAVGTNGDSVVDSAATLGNEGFRTAFASVTKPATGHLQQTAVIQDDEAVFHIKEIGVFAGLTATTSPNTGVLVSRVLWEREKTALESIQIMRLDKIVRG